MKRALVFSRRFPFPPKHGSHHRTLQTIRLLLSAGYGVHAVFQARQWDDRYDASLMDLQIESRAIELTWLERRIDGLWQRWTGRVDVWDSPSKRQQFAKIAKRVAPALIWVNYADGMRVVGRDAPAPVVVDTHDFISLSHYLGQSARARIAAGAADFRPLGDMEREFWKATDSQAEIALEFQHLARADLITAISEREGELLQSRLKKPVATHHYFRELAAERSTASDIADARGGPPCGVAPLGAEGNPLNHLGMACLDRAMRAASAPDGLVVATGQLAAALVTGGWCRAVGNVADYDRFIEGFDYGVCVPFWGTGAQIKQYEFAMLGMPVVAYRDVVDPELWQHELNALLVDAPDEMARAIIRLSTDRGLVEHLRQGARSLPDRVRSRAHRQERELHRLLGTIGTMAQAG
jgi:hypothetical protein